MFDLDWWQEIWITITHNKSRSVLTAFGVFWGMFMLVVMVGSGIALERGVMGQINSFATNSCFFETERTSEPYKGFRKGRGWNILNEDIPIILNKVPEIEYFTPILFGGRSEKNVMVGDKYGTYAIKGNYPSYNDIDRSKLLAGRYINDIDILEKRKVCVIGDRVQDELYGKDVNPIGSNIQVNGIYFQVVGVIEGSGTISIGGSNSESVCIPFSTLQQAFNQGNVIQFIAATARPGIKVRVVEEKVAQVLKELHNISPTDKTAVWTMNFEEQFVIFEYLGLGIAALIWVVGLGTLIAGGIGISNIMLVTVRERTKEIGIRRALGAKPENIITQIMSESVILTIIAGIAGLMLGVGLLQLLGLALGGGTQFFKDPQISFTVAISALIILVVIGTVAGYLPAKRAMSIKPIEAISEE
ncbi:MAG: ABC transporter permease [Prevotellaceae bacterium]|nr:ABC transporter permease [Prevotellaceae bacterium]